MQKKLITAAVAATLGTGAAVTALPASADSVTVYGQIRQELNYADNGTDSGLRLDDSGAQSRVGVKADKDLGNGLKAVAVFEWILEACGSSGGSAGGDAGSNNNGCRQDFHTARQQFVGLQGNFGRLAFGRFNGSYKLVGGVNYDGFAATSLQARGNGGQAGGGATGGYVSNGFMDDLIEYKSPKLGLFTFMIQYGVDDPQNPNGAADTKGDYNINAKVSDKNWEVIAAGSHSDRLDQDNFKVGGKMKFGPLSASLQFEDAESGNAGKGKFWHGQLIYKVGKFDLIGGYGQFNADDTANWGDAKHWAFGGKYHLGKKVWIYGGYAQLDRDDLADKVKNWALGMHMSF